MKLAKLTLAELEKMDLNGVLVTKLLVEADETSASFEINGMEIEFVIDNEGKAHGTALILNDKTYTDAETLAKCIGWVDYVATVVKKIMSEQQTKIEEAENAKKIEKIVPPSLPVIPEFKIETLPIVPDFKIEAEIVKEEPVFTVVDEDEEYEYEEYVDYEEDIEEELEIPSKQILPEIPLLREKIIEKTPVNEKIGRIQESSATTNDDSYEGVVMQNRRIAEAFERGRREGYTESRKMNLVEVKKVRRRATIFIFILILLFAAAFGILYIRFGQYVQLNVPEVLQIFN